MTKLDRAVEALAVRQAGAFARYQAVAVGASSQAVSRRVASGAWVRLRPPKTFRLASCPPSWEQRLWAASLWAGEDAAISHRAAAALLGLERFEPGPVEVTVPYGANRRCPGARVHTSHIAPSECRRVSGLVVTGPERTLIDLAGLGSVRSDAVEDAVESAFRLGLTTPERLGASVAPDDRAGSSLLRRFLSERAPGRPQGSTLEGRWARLARTAGLGKLVRQHEVWVGGQRFFLDYAFPDRLLAIELDGFAKMSTKAAKQGLLARDTLLRSAGWMVLHFTWDDVRLHPEWVLECIRSTLAA